MGTVWVECWKCDVCGFRWIKKGVYPKQCASSKCRKRGWNGGLPVGQTQPVCEGMVVDKQPRPFARLEVAMNPAMEKFMENLPSGGGEQASEEAGVMCRYREYDGESGETMVCGLAEHGPKKKHGNWKILG